MAASDRTPAFKRVLYAVKTTGDTWFQPTIASTDSPDTLLTKQKHLHNARFCLLKAKKY